MRKTDERRISAKTNFIKREAGYITSALKWLKKIWTMNSLHNRIYGTV
jgi:hypothetical protein